MLDRISLGEMAMAAALHMAVGGAAAFDETKYPDWKGQWTRTVAPRWVPGGTKLPLTPEYQAIYEGQSQGPGRRQTGHGPDLYLPLARHAADHEHV
jgi:hypothetical protein